MGSGLSRGLLAFFLFIILFSVDVSAHSDQIVSVTEDGFEPESVKIHVGDKVVWANHGDAQHWPASDLHPLHTTYPGSDISKCETDPENILDACRSLEKGERYEFVFDRAGKW